MNKIKILLCLVLLSLVSLSSYIYITLKISSPVMEGKVIIPALKDKVEILRDKEGIPHIYAKKRVDMFFALGFVQASDRLFQFDIIRRAGAGRTAEIIGAKTLEVDKLFRILGGQRTFENRLKHLPKELLSDFESYTAGLNYYMDNYPLPIEYKVLRTRPEKFTIMDAYYVYTYLAYSFTPMLREDQLHSKLVRTIKNRDLSMLTSIGNHIPSEKVSMIDNFSIDRLVGIDKILSNLSPLEGSNAWAISGEKTKSGSPILASDPHISFSVPNIWYEAHLNCEEDDYQMYGHFLPLIPYPAMGHNFEFGWGLTMSYADDLDLFQEQIKGENYIFNSKERKLEYKNEVIKVRGDKDYVMKIPLTIRGPIGDEIMDTKGVSINWAFYLDSNKPMYTFYQMSKAKNMAQVKEAVSHSKSPGMNVLYADKEGNIAQFIFGAYLKRSHPEYSNVINKGSSEVLGIYDFDLKPHRENPENGVLISTNDKPQNSKIDMRGLWYPKNRHDTVEQNLSVISKWDAKMMRRVQTSNLDVFAIKYNKTIVSILRRMFHHLDDFERKSLDIMAKWDGKSDVDSVGATLYNHFNYTFLPIVLDELDSEDRLQYCFSTASWYFHQRLFENLDNPWWDKAATKQVESSQETIVEVYKASISDLKRKLGHNLDSWQWGNIHQIEFPHPFGMNKILGKIFNQGPYPVAGAINVVNHNRRKGCENGHAVKSGPSTRRIIDFANPAISYGILPLGNSGHLLSPFYDNQRERFLKGEYRNQYLNILDVKKNLHSRLELIAN